jgi:hypothetical protein
MKWLTVADLAAILGLRPQTIYNRMSSCPDSLPPATRIPDNPGRFLCHGVFDDAGSLVHATQDADQARRFAETGGLTDHDIVSIDPQREGWTRVNRQW